MEKKKNLLGLAHKFNQVELNWIMFLIDRPKYVINKTKAHDVMLFDAHILLTQIKEYLSRDIHRLQRDVLWVLLKKLQEHCHAEEPTRDLFQTE